MLFRSERAGTAFFELTKREGLEGIVAKRKDGKYHISKRTRDWLKISAVEGFVDRKCFLSLPSLV